MENSYEKALLLLKKHLHFCIPITDCYHYVYNVYTQLLVQINVFTSSYTFFLVHDIFKYNLV